MESQSEYESPEAQALRRARKQVKALRGWYVHLSVFMLVNLMLLLMNLMIGRGYWFVWSSLWWGVGLMIHGLVVWSKIGAFGKDWEERKIREYMERDGS
jgi:hypothetical protein